MKNGKTAGITAEILKYADGPTWRTLVNMYTKWLMTTKISQN